MTNSHKLLLFFFIVIIFSLSFSENNFITARYSNSGKLFFEEGKCTDLSEFNSSIFVEMYCSNDDIEIFVYNENCSQSTFYENRTIIKGGTFKELKNLNCDSGESLNVMNIKDDNHYIILDNYDDECSTSINQFDLFRLNHCDAVLTNDGNLNIGAMYLKAEANSSVIKMTRYEDENCTNSSYTTLFDYLYPAQNCYFTIGITIKFQIGTLEELSERFEVVNLSKDFPLPLEYEKKDFAEFTLHYGETCDNYQDNSYAAKSLYPLNSCQHRIDQIYSKTYLSYDEWISVFYQGSDSCTNEEMKSIRMATFLNLSTCKKIPDEEADGYAKTFFQGHTKLSKGKYLTLDLKEEYPEKIQYLPTVFPQECDSEKPKLEEHSAVLLYYNKDFCISSSRDDSILTEGKSYKGECDADGNLTMKEYDGDNCLNYYIDITNDKDKLCISEGKAFFDCSFRVCNGIFSYDKTVCNGHGECVSYDQCNCKDDYTGQFCQTEPVRNENGDLEGIVIVLIIVCLVVFSFFSIVLIIFVIVFILLCAKYLKYKKIEDIDLILDEQRLNKEGKIANIKINRKLFKIDYSNLQIIKKIGEGGGGGAIFLSKYHGSDVAFKAFNTDDICSDQNNFNEFEKEVEVLANVKHPYILNFLGAVIHPPRVGILMEFCKNGDLKQFLSKNKNYEFSKKLKFLKQISSACSYLHEKKIIHRDMKSENILIDDSENCKLMDFGLSKVISEILADEMTKGVGTSCYMAPEVVKGGKYDEKCDVYSTSIIFWEIFTEDFKPFGKSMTFGIERKIAENPEMRPLIEKEKFNNQEWLIDLIKKMWSHNPTDRCGFTEILKVLNEHETAN